MTDSQDHLYHQAQADFMREREKSWDNKQKAKFNLLIENLGDCQTLVDIGCGWGQFLQIIENSVDEIWGVDESPDRLKDIETTCPSAKIVICRADDLKIPSDYFDIAITSQMLHEVKLFGSQAELNQIIQEIYRILNPGGKYLLVDHLDAGNGDVTVEFPDQTLALLKKFVSSYKYYGAQYELNSDNTVTISKRCLQDFLTKIWSFDSAMQEIEMNETHNVFKQKETKAYLTDNGFTVDSWIEFASISEDLQRVDGKLLSGDVWNRKFLCIGTKT